MIRTANQPIPRRAEAVAIPTLAEHGYAFETYQEIL